MSGTTTQNDPYLARWADKDGDRAALGKLYSLVFPDEDVAGLATVMYDNLPDMNGKNWCVIEAGRQIVAAAALIPWTWTATHRSADGRLTSVELKVAEQGIVGTHPDHRGRGLMRRINDALDEGYRQGGYHLAAIQGIPGFYQNFGYRYALPWKAIWRWN
jgi:GNAT superfamily N-acetyltransferase